MREYALYLFDFDNTLFDTRCGIEAILREALPVLGVDYGPDSFDECLGLTMDQVYDRYMGDDRSRYRDFERSFMSVVMSDAYLGAPPFPETARVLESLKKRGKRIGVVSGKKSIRQSGFARNSFSCRAISAGKSSANSPERCTPRLLPRGTKGSGLSSW